MTIDHMQVTTTLQSLRGLPSAGESDCARNRAAHIRRSAKPLVREPSQTESTQIAIDFVARVFAAKQLDVRRHASAVRVGRQTSRRLVLLLTRRLAQQ